MSELTPAEKLNLKPGKDGKIHIFNNGIFNGKFDDPAAAAKYANQLADAANGEIYIIHFPQAGAVNKHNEGQVLNVEFTQVFVCL